MADSRPALLLASFLLACGPDRGLADEPRDAAESVERSQVTVTGLVLSADGTPARGAAVEAEAGPGEPPNVVRADRSGRFRIRGVFGNGARLHACSEDGTHQSSRIIAAPAVRSARPIVLRLAPAVAREVSVLADGRPVPRAHVLASGHAFTVRGRTDRDGRVRLHVPANNEVRELVAWHPALGSSGRRYVDVRKVGETTHLVLLPPSPLTIRAVGPDDKPVSGLALGAHFTSDGFEWSLVGKFDEASARTDAEGRATLPWAPREALKYVDVIILSTRWKIDETDLERLGERVVTVHVRHMLPVTGRLVMPAGENPEGLLILGYGFGPGHHGQIPYARCRADGSFTFNAASDHGYVLGIADLEWVCEAWAGLIFAREIDRPATISLAVRRATPLTGRVTRGGPPEPVPDAWLEIGSPADLTWTDSSGKTHRATTGIRYWTRSDGEGQVRAGVGRGNHKVRLSFDAWEEERTITVASMVPVAVDFYRRWPRERQVVVRLVSDGGRFTPSAQLSARAWTPRPRGVPATTVEPEASPDGSFKLVFDAESVTLFFFDPKQRRSGYTELDSKSSAVDLVMEPTATYGGTLLDENSQPLPGQTLSMRVKGPRPTPIATVETDATGRFRFAALPARVPLWLDVGDGRESSQYFVADGDRVFTPGEVRESDDIRPAKFDPRTGAATRPLRLGDRVDETCRDARLAGMYALAILKGDSSAGVAALVEAVMDDDRVGSVLSFLPMVVEPAECKSESKMLEVSGWRSPQPGTVVLVVLNSEGKPIATTAIAACPLAAASTAADDFLRQHRPVARDARAALTVAREEARKSDRRVWIVCGGPRCGPCFRLARWMEDQHERLARDYVVVKVLGGLDAHADEVIKELPIQAGDGIPWHAITRPDGSVLITSRGDAGNIGFPTSVDDFRQLRQMLERTAQRLSPAEIDSLIKSLSGPR